MGKKSRKKGGEDKVSRKEKLQERRDRVEEQLATNTATAQHDDTTIAINEHTLLEGDIVWFDKEEYEHYNDDSDPNEYRGIVHKVSPSVCKVQPLSNIFRNDSSCVDIDRAAHYIRRHMNTNWTTRLDVGDKVVCYAKRGWVSGTVKNLWPIWARQGNTSDFEVPAYNILCSDLQKVAAPEDEDYCVMQHPEKFRFKVGDKIILNCRKAVTGKTVPSTGMHWVPGLVTRVDFVNTNADAYAAYLCTTEVAPEVCVVSDDDEHICAEDAKPRDRLLESIDQDCSYDHIDFLVKSYDIDVIPIRDMLFRRAMEQGSFHALRWLEENADLPMWKPRFANGNTILHQMATSPFAQRFLRGFHSYSRDSSAKDTSLTEFKYRNSGEESCHLVTNLSGETWLEVLVKSNNIKAIQFALTLRDGLFGSLLIASFRLEQEILEKLVMIAHNNSVKKIMVDQFTRNCALFAQISALAFISRSLYGKESDFLIKNQCMTSFRGDGAIESATRLIRFVRQWQDESWCRIFKISNVLEQVIKAGYSHIFISMVKADPSILQEQLHLSYTSRESQNEYAQPELFVETDYRDYRAADALILSVHGDAPSRPYFSDLESRRGSMKLYLNELVHILHPSNLSADKIVDFDSLVTKFKDKAKKLEGRRGREADIWKHQLHFLEDDASLPGRLRILEFLVNAKGMKAPTILDAIRVRQCGVVRWIVGNSLLLLDDRAIKDNNINSPQGRKLLILGGQRIPNTVSSGTFLAHACIEFDALQTLAWLVEDQKVTIDGILGGFNLLHACAFFGRMEILLWLSTRDGFGDLKEAISTRKGFLTASAVHIAVMRGHLFIADLLLGRFGCPTIDGMGRTPDAIATSSPHDFVKEWGQVKARPFTLGKEIDKLVRHLSKKSYSAAKNHINSTKCLSIESWNQADIFTATESLPSGKSFRSIVLQCLRGHNESFVLWLCRKLTTTEATWGNEHFLNDLNRFWDKKSENTLSYSYTFDRLDLDKVRAMVADDNEASSWISYCWNGTPFFMDPQDSNPIIWADLLEGDLASTFWKQAFMIEICRGLLKSSEEHARSSLSKGMPAEVITLAAVFIGAAHRLARLLECDLESIFHASNLFNNNDDRYINMGCFLLDHMGYDENHAIRGNMPHYLCSPFDLSHLHTAIAIEGYSHLLRFCNRHGSGWTASMEIEMTRIGAFLSHDDIMSFFLTSESDHFESSYQERCHAAMLGAASAARQKKWVQLLHLCGHFPDACVEGEDDIEGEDVDKKRARREAAANSSLAACIVFGYLTTKSHPMDSHFVYEAMMKRLIASYGYSALCFLRAASILFETYCIRPPLSVFEAFMLFLYTDLKLEPWSTEAMQCSRTIFDSLSFLSRVVDKEGGEERAVNWVKTLEDWGVDIQEIDKEDIPSCKESFLEKISSLKEKQLETWAKLDMIKQGSSLSDIKEAFEAKSLHLNMRDRGGLHLSHVAAVHNRVDVLQWLVEAQHVSLHDLDHQKRTVLDVAIASKADAAAAWIKDRNAKAKISAFLRNYFRKSLSLRRKARLIAGAARLQAVHRGRVTRKRYRGLLLVQVEESKRYSTIWAGISQALDATDLRFPSWSSLRNLNNSRLAEVDHLDELLATGERLEAAAAMAAALEDENDTDVDGAQEADDYESQSTFDAAHESASLASDNVTPRTKIHLSADVVKWLRQADGKYRDFFVRRVQQLSAGDRSRILEKHLKGSSSTIYETYLEQKSGHRILWQYESADSILIWYVAKHKSVSRLMRLIDDSQSRSARQRISASALPELAESNECAGENQSRNILLNPRGNVPLKVYKIDSSELEQIVDPDWSPQLYLTHEERNIVEEVGTVLLLGRSGTGKTVCICNRMDLDRQLNYHNSCFTQLFIARSQRLSNYVKETVGECQGCTFSTFTKLVESLENRLPKLDTVGDLFLPSQQMNFARFKRDVHAGPRDMVDPMVAWTNIRTFLKGSIEALVEQEQVMTKEAFLGLGKKRCRLATTEREAVYDLFIRYQKVMERQNLWDYCDRITSLLKRLQASQEEEHPSYDTVRYTKIYVDEIQDYTQGEILLFFQLSGPGQLFLAGDPAQSVVEGVEFRFEEIRSVGYHVAGPERRELIPQKPKIVTVNFRSHSGVLDTAAAVLQRMFDALVMTQDEWIASGLENAELSEANDEFDLDVAMSLLEKSLILFRTRKRVRFGAKGSCSSHVTSVSTGATAKANK